MVRASRFVLPSKSGEAIPSQWGTIVRRNNHAIGGESPLCCMLGCVLFALCCFDDRQGQNEHVLFPRSKNFQHSDSSTY